MKWKNVPDGHPTDVPLPDGTAVLLQTDSNKVAHFVLVGAGHRVVENIGTADASHDGQVGFTAAAGQYVAFVYHLSNGADGQNAQNVWRLYLFNRTTGKLAVVGEYQKDASGQPVQGGWPQPVMTDQYLYWVQAADTGLPWGGSEIVQYNIARATSRIVYRGLAQALAPFGNELVFTGVPADADRSATDVPWSVLAVDQDSGSSVPAPTGISAAADGAFTMAASDGTIVWNTHDGGINGWRADWGHSVVLVPGLSSNNDANWKRPASMRISGAGEVSIYNQFLAWSADGQYLMDLKTGSFTSLSTRTGDSSPSGAGGLATAGSMLSLEEFTADTRPAVGDPIDFNQTVIDLARLADLPQCS